jgi:hypothetical protein
MPILHGYYILFLCRYLYALISMEISLTKWTLLFHLTLGAFLPEMKDDCHTLASPAPSCYTLTKNGGTPMNVFAFARFTGSAEADLVSMRA